MPRGSGRRRVRAISASMRASSTWLIAAADDAASAMPIVPQKSAPAGGKPGTARNMPTIAVNMMRDTTFGFVSAKYSRARAETLPAVASVCASRAVMRLEMLSRTCEGDAPLHRRGVPFE